MQLKHIKLAGFKSFVDPTKIGFPTNLVGVVGPNGCGKSNVIDAVRWVLGELSAKNLRGESMVDVIFNGTDSRKPSGQCSIELLFDNASGKIGGEYASFNEISTKRVMTRDAQSTYFINNTKCRRKDVQDIFLGTGLGPSSYAIIEQGMVSKLVSAKPEELRTHIEEAAGVSKYRERRRETESRIKKTKENLSRVNDIRDEIAIPNIGEKKYKNYMSFLLTVFFFVWFLNMLGLTPLGVNVTGNIAITFSLALMTFIITQVSGKKDYWRHIFWMPGVPVLIRPALAIIELIGLVVKPFSLMIRLYANMLAGHVVLMSIIGLIFIFESWIAAPAFLGLTVVLSLLELLVAALQAYIFTMLTALYFGSDVEEHAHH